MIWHSVSFVDNAPTTVSKMALQKLPCHGWAKIIVVMFFLSAKVRKTWERMEFGMSKVMLSCAKKYFHFLSPTF